MRVERLGETAYIVRDLPCEPWRYSEALSSRSIAGLEEAVASYETVGLYVDPDVFLPASVELAVDRLGTDSTPDLHEIPVCYELGLDLNEASNKLALRPSELVRLHSETVYRCYAIGFMPGFPYLGYLPKAISGLGRLASPRTQVPRGSVGITGRQTGIYPSASPGGWWLIGQTPLKMVDLETGFFRMHAGDEVRFVPIDSSRFQELEETQR